MIIYEDDSILVCEKPAGFSSEAGEFPEILKQMTASEEIYCVHRLDRDTAGLMVYAKTAQAASGISRDIASHKMKKVYLAAVEGIIPEAGQMNDLLFHDKGLNKSYVVRRMRKGVRAALLNYCRLSVTEDMSLGGIQLQTGRTHQIRVQFASRGHPLVGDRKYGSSFRNCSLALWSAELNFTHPVTREALRFFSSPPQVFPWTQFAVQPGADLLSPERFPANEYQEEDK